MSTLGLPSIEVTFKQLAASLINRSAKGIVCLIIKDNTNILFSIKTYTDVMDVVADSSLYAATNYNAIYDAFLGSPSKVIVCRIATTDAISVATAQLTTTAFNYLAFVDGTQADQNALVTWVKSQNLTRFKRIKLVAYKASVTDDEHIINFYNTTVTRTGASSIAGHLYLGRIAGVLAGLPMTQSATYYKFTDLSTVAEVADVAAAIGSGQLVLTTLEDSVVIARGVNSLQTITNKSDDWKFITIVEAMDLIYEDIKSTFRDDYVGKYKNNASNQTLLLSSINGYFRDLAKEYVLDDGYNNIATVDTAAMRDVWTSKGKDVSELSDEDVRKLTIGTDVLINGDIKVLNAIEGLKFAISMF